MKPGNWAKLLLVAAPLLIGLAGCGDFWQAPSGTTTTCTSNCTTLSSGIFYVLDQGTSEVVALSINSGSLNTIGTYTLPSAGALAMVLSPNGSFLYVSTLSDG